MSMRMVVMAAAMMVVAGCGDDAAVPPPQPPTPAATGAVAGAATAQEASAAPAAAPVAAGPLEATPGTAVHAYSVPSIHCEGCAGTIRTKVGKLAGVDAVSVSVKEHRVWVRVNEGGPGAEAVGQALTAAGYDATPIAAPQASELQAPPEPAAVAPHG